jgi:hypothetical protein
LAPEAWEVASEAFWKNDRTFNNQWIGLGENLQENHGKPHKNNGKNRG